MLLCYKPHETRFIQNVLYRRKNETEGKHNIWFLKWGQTPSKLPQKGRYHDS